MDEKKICSDFLFSNSSFITGAATIFNLSGDFYEYNSSASDIEADQKAICNDFKVVGKDLKSAIEEFTPYSINFMSSGKNSQDHRTQLTRLEDEVIRTEPELFTGLPKNRARKIVQTVAVSMKSHSGPLPDPETLNRYNEIIPNGADRIMIGFEKQLDHRIEIENHAIKGQVRKSDRGQLFAFIIALIVLFASF